MNFDFIKNVESLNRIYKYCNNAEELAISMPYLSEIAARKSAETIAKYVYSFAHVKEIDKLSFLDILKDPLVKEYIADRNVMDAFHEIRKSGNDAVHTDKDVSSDDAIVTLEDLHFILGEVAIRMGMILDYPEFDDQVIENTGVTEMLDFDSSALAREMYDEYVIFTHRVDRLRAAFDDLTAKIRVSPGEVDLFEMIEFRNKPKLENTVLRIQEYFGSIGNAGIKRLVNSDTNENEDMNVALELSIEGEKNYRTDDLVRATKGILYDLDKAESFTIFSKYSGESRAPWFNTDHQNADAFEMADIEEFTGNSGVEESIKKYQQNAIAFDSPIPGIDKNEEFTYKIIEILYNHGGGCCDVYENGEWIDPSQYYSTDIIDKDYGEDWWTWDISLVIKFDFEEYGEVMENLHELVRKYVPEEELYLCVDNWEGDDAENEIILDGIQWCPRKLSEVQLFLDNVNELISPIRDECNIVADGKWFISKDPLAVAELQNIDGELKITGTEL